MTNELAKDYTLNDVAKALGMSERWVRSKLPQVEHTRYGHKVRFTTEQFEAFKAQFVEKPVAKSVTTGRKKSA